MYFVFFFFGLFVVVFFFFFCLQSVTNISGFSGLATNDCIRISLFMFIYVCVIANQLKIFSTHLFFSVDIGCFIVNDSYNIYGRDRIVVGYCKTI